jgi:hypothetical protein
MSRNRADGPASHASFWRRRNLHPATTLVYAAASSDPAARGVLVASSMGLTFVPATAPYDKQVIQGDMAGLPTCAAALGTGGMHVLGDSQGRFYLLDLRRQQLVAVQLSSPVAAPSTLAVLGGWSSAGAAAGAECCTALHCTALHCTALHCTALHCTALHCTACQSRG